MDFLPLSTLVIDNDTKVTLLDEVDMTLSLPDHDEIETLRGSTLLIANKEYTIVEATTEPKLSENYDLIGTYVFLNVEKKRETQVDMNNL